MYSEHIHVAGDAYSQQNVTGMQAMCNPGLVPGVGQQQFRSTTMPSQLPSRRIHQVIQDPQTVADSILHMASSTYPSTQTVHVPIEKCRSGVADTNSTVVGLSCQPHGQFIYSHWSPPQVPFYGYMQQPHQAEHQTDVSSTTIENMYFNNTSTFPLHTTPQRQDMLASVSNCFSSVTSPNSTTVNRCIPPICTSPISPTSISSPTSHQNSLNNSGQNSSPIIPTESLWNTVSRGGVSEVIAPQMLVQVDSRHLKPESTGRIHAYNNPMLYHSQEQTNPTISGATAQHTITNISPYIPNGENMVSSVSSMYSNNNSHSKGHHQQQQQQQQKQQQQQTYYSYTGVGNMHYPQERQPYDLECQNQFRSSYQMYNQEQNTKTDFGMSHQPNNRTATSPFSEISSPTYSPATSCTPRPSPSRPCSQNDHRGNRYPESPPNLSNNGHVDQTLLCTNNPLLSLEKLVQLSESQVVDPKSIVDDVDMMELVPSQSCLKSRDQMQNCDTNTLSSSDNSKARRIDDDSLSSLSSAASSVRQQQVEADISLSPSLSALLSETKIITKPSSVCSDGIHCSPKRVTGMTSDEEEEEEEDADSSSPCLSTTDQIDYNSPDTIDMAIIEDAKWCNEHGEAPDGKAESGQNLDRNRKDLTVNKPKSGTVSSTQPAHGLKRNISSVLDICDKSSSMSDPMYSSRRSKRLAQSRANSVIKSLENDLSKKEPPDEIETPFSNRTKSGSSKLNFDIASPTENVETSRVISDMDKSVDLECLVKPGHSIEAMSPKGRNNSFKDDATDDITTQTNYQSAKGKFRSNYARKKCAQLSCSFTSVDKISSTGVGENKTESSLQRTGLRKKELKRPNRKSKSSVQYKLSDADNSDCCIVDSETAAEVSSESGKLKGDRLHSILSSVMNRSLTVVAERLVIETDSEEDAVPDIKKAQPKHVSPCNKLSFKSGTSKFAVPNKIVSCESIAHQKKRRQNESIQSPLNKSSAYLGSSSKHRRDNSGPLIRFNECNEEGEFVIVNEVQDDMENTNSSKKKVTDSSSVTSSSICVQISNLPTEKSVFIAGHVPSEDMHWVCALCHRHSSYSFLGDLFGPYFPEGNQPSSSNESVKAKKYNPSHKKVTFVQSDQVPDELVSMPLVKNCEDMCAEYWLHQECALWSDMVFQVGNKVYGLQEAVTVAEYTTCTVCSGIGATIGCLQKNCSQKFHYVCAVETDCYLDNEKLSLLCPKHKGGRYGAHRRVNPESTR